MDIMSRKLTDALRDVVSYFPGSTLLGEKSDVPGPYRMLIHHQDELRAYKNNHPDCHDLSYREECNRHIDMLLEFFDHHSGKAVRDEQAR